MKYFIALLTLLAQTLSVALASPSVKEGHYVFDSGKILLKKIAARPELTVDLVSAQGYEVYGPTGLGKFLENLQAESIPLTLVETQQYSTKAKYYASNYQEYPTNEDDIKLYRELEAKYPSLVKVSSIGKTYTGQEIYVIKISDNVENDEVEPEFSYIANMHGNEVVGRRLMIQLMQEMLESYASGSDEFANLINFNELYFIPTLNPEGYQKRQRGNAKWTDINRDFPDFLSSDNQNIPAKRTEETVAMMNFHAGRHLALSGSFHDGAVVVNYPWDTTKAAPPLHSFIVDLSRLYAERNEDMKNSHEFEDGITNGYAWYEVNGGMQDWAFYYHDNLMITFELSNIKWPKWSEIERQYQLNRDSMVAFMQQIKSGAGFFFSDRQLSGRVEILSITSKENLGKFPFHQGEFYKVLPAARYQLNIFDLEGNLMASKDVEVRAEQEKGTIIPIN